MSELSASPSKLPPEQEAIRAKSFHPSGTFVEFPKEEIEQSIPERFEKIVRMYPDRLAVKIGERALTYDELNLTANRIARAILSARGEESQPVALLFEHGIDVITGIFGSLKASKFHVALDPSFPRERIIHILEDSQAGLIVTNNLNVDLARRLTNNRRLLLNIDEINPSLPCGNLDLSILPTDLAKFRYTSGSTGKPTGVVKTHRDVLSRAMSVINDEMHTCVEDRLSLLHSPSFASADHHLFSSLLNGAALYPFDIKSQGISRLVKWLQEEQITVYHSPPQVFRQLAEELSSEEKIASIRLIHLSGAPISRRDFELYKANFAPGPLLEIGMGSTEFRGICFALLDRTFRFPTEGSPVGYPRPGREILLFDESGNEVIPGEVGEIVVKGRNVDPGYWNQGASKFGISPDPNCGDEHLYLTGDLGRMLPDGFFIHLGRKDLIIKIRGYRVNIGEVEAALLEHPQINEVGVAAWERDPGEKYLVGYIVPRKGFALNVSDLNKFLADKLPEYMVPSTFMFLESLPLTNGKLNRSALPKPDNRRPEIRTPYVLPRSDLEHTLSLIWSDILTLDQVGIHDNFFDLGGHSLAAMRVVSQVIKKFQLERPLQSLFQSPTIAEMAAVIVEHQGERLGEEGLERMLGELELMSDEEATRLLTGDAASKSGGDRNE
jgi:amino acid adenylation domain-containing protein